MYSVKTQIFTISAENPDPSIILYAIEKLRSGGLVAFPTETVYGLGANAFDADAVERVFEVKKRPSYDPVIVHISSISQIDKVACDIPAIAYKLAEEYWPGALTLVLNKHPQIASNVSAGLNTVAVRMPNHRIPLAMIEASNIPIAAPSANLFTKPSPTTAHHVVDDLDGHVDIILDGGICSIGLESTVLDLTSENPTVLRPGGVSIEALKKSIFNLQLNQKYIETHNGLAMPSPGMLSKHYSPNAKLLLLTGNSDIAIIHLLEIISALTSQEVKIGIMVTDEDARYFSELNIEIVKLGSENNLSEIGQNLFAQMRNLDKVNVDLILIRAVRLHGLGLAIWDRLVRASEQHVYDLDEPINIDLITQAITHKKSS